MPFFRYKNSLVWINVVAKGFVFGTNVLSLSLELAWQKQTYNTGCLSIRKQALLKTIYTDAVEMSWLPGRIRVGSGRIQGGYSNVVIQIWN